MAFPIPLPPGIVERAIAPVLPLAAAFRLTSDLLKQRDRLQTAVEGFCHAVRAAGGQYKWVLVEAPGATAALSGDLAALLGKGATWKSSEGARIVLLVSPEARDKIRLMKLERLARLVTAESDFHDLALDLAPHADEPPFLPLPLDRAQCQRLLEEGGGPLDEEFLRELEKGPTAK